MNIVYRLDDTTEFREWPKIARLNRDIVITEKLDGTNACVIITEDQHPETGEVIRVEVCAQSRTRLLEPGVNDNFGFAAWVEKHAVELYGRLGHGYHYGEWFGGKIQRGYGLKEKRFALFNTGRFTADPERVTEKIGLIPQDACDGTLTVVAVLYQGVFSQHIVANVLAMLEQGGSAQAPGFLNPEGIVVYHIAAGEYFKVTLDDDGLAKTQRKTRNKEAA